MVNQTQANVGTGNGKRTDPEHFRVFCICFTKTAIRKSDLNNDGRLDLAVANYLGNNVGILLGYGNGSFAQQTTYSTGDGFDTWMITIGDLNNDNMPDILVTNYGADSVGIFFGYGDGSFTSQMIFPTGIGSKPIAAAIWDFNSDNRSDIVVVNYNSDNVILLLRDSSQPFLTMTTFLTGKNSNLQYMAIADVNKDNFLDIIVANNGNDNIGILLGYGNGSLMKQITYATGNGSSPSSVAVGDFNNDSLADIAVANTGANNVGILLGYGNGTFSAITSYSTGNVSNPYSVSVADFNNDKCLDMAVSNLGSKSVQVKQTDHGSSFWPRFSLVFVNDVGQNFVICDKCRTIVTYKSSTGTGGLKKHLASCDKITLSNTTQSIITTYYTASKPSIIPEKIKKEVTNAYLEFIALDGRPFEIVSRIGFKNMLETIFKAGKITANSQSTEISDLLPHPTTVSRKVDQVYSF
ncbi:unnamed protein product [Rotaria socialis]|uniref:Hermes trasposase DNA-binding domain-containing protein n=1 Tax=Rotaria socialis TaxID=392032 RepID=A0A818Q9P4_9BILA|nr:unnamed protein product [Rotaria socialis]